MQIWLLADNAYFLQDRKCYSKETQQEAKKKLVRWKIKNFEIAATAIQRQYVNWRDAYGQENHPKVFKQRTSHSAISQILWALQGITYVKESPEGEGILHKVAPSAGRTYPLKAYVALSTGLYRYKPRRHTLHLVNEKDIRDKLAEAALTPLNKAAIKTAPLTIILTADNQRALKATPLMENAVRFIHLEAGHATQNLVLQAVSLGLGVCTLTSYQLTPSMKR